MAKDLADVTNTTETTSTISESSDKCVHPSIDSDKIATINQGSEVLLLTSEDNRSSINEHLPSYEPQIILTDEMENTIKNSSKISARKEKKQSSGKFHLAVKTSNKKRTLQTVEKIKNYQRIIKTIRQALYRIRQSNCKLKNDLEHKNKELESFDDVRELLPSMKGLLECEKNEDTYALIILDQV